MNFLHVFRYCNRPQYHWVELYFSPFGDTHTRSVNKRTGDFAWRLGNRLHCETGPALRERGSETWWLNGRYIVNVATCADLINYL